MSAEVDPLDPPPASRGRAAVTRSMRALSIRNFRIFFVGEVVSTVGSWMQMLAQVWLVLELTGSGGALGVTMALQTLPVLLFGVWAGVVADRVDNRRLLVVTALAGTAQAIAVGLMVATGNITVHWIYFFAFVLGVVTAFDRPAMQAMNYELAGPDDLPSAIGIASTINSGGRLLGPALAGILVGTIGLAPVFFLNAATFAAVVVAMALIRPAEMFSRTANIAKVRLRDGLSYVWHHPTLRLAMLVMAVVGTFAYNFAIIVPSMIRFEFHSTPIALGVVQAIGGVGSVAGGLVAGSFYRPTIRVLGMVAAAFGAFIALDGTRALARALRAAVAAARHRLRGVHDRGPECPATRVGARVPGPRDEPVHDRVDGHHADRWAHRRRRHRHLVGARRPRSRRDGRAVLRIRRPRGQPAPGARRRGNVRSDGGRHRRRSHARPRPRSRRRDMSRAFSVDLGAVASLRFAVTRLARQLRQEALADGDLTPSKLSALASVNRLGPVSLGDLAVVERVSAPSITRTVDALVAASLVTRASDPSDRRLVRVAITAAGMQLLEQSRRRKDALLAQRIALLGARDQARLVAAIPVIQRLLDDEPE